MAIAIRKKDGKFYSPSRDINNWFVQACRASVRVAAEVFKDDQQSLERLKDCGIRMAEAFNEALLADQKQVPDVVNAVARELQLRPNEFSVLSRIFMVIVFWRFVAGAREASDTPEMSERDLTNAMTDAAVMAVLPDNLSAEVAKALKLSGQWPSPAFDLAALFALQHDGPNEREQEEDGACKAKTSE